jgi:hypothetical protein
VKISLMKRFIRGKLVARQPEWVGDEPVRIRIIARADGIDDEYELGTALAYDHTAMPRLLRAIADTYEEPTD